MLVASPNFYMLLFCVSIVATYLIVRLRVASVPGAATLGLFVNSFSFFLYSLSRNNGLEQAALVGLSLGVIFTVASISLAIVFKAEKTAPAQETLVPVSTSK